MRNGVTSAYINFALNCTRAVIGHLYTFNASGGAFDYFTDLDFDIIYNGNVFKSTGLRIDGMRRKVSVGLEVDEQELHLMALPMDTLFGSNFLTAAETGLLDGCLLTRQRAIWPVATGNLLQDVANNPPAQVFTMFTGYASKIEKGGQTLISMKFKSPLVKLEVNMPRNYYQAGCLWTLFDSGCTLNKNLFAVNGVVSSAFTGGNVLPVGGVPNPISPDGIATYAQGRILFTSGPNNGLLTRIGNNDNTIIFVAYPFDVAPNPGDTFTYYPGCSKSFNTCNLKFNNANNFRGFDKVPPIMVSL